MVFYGPPSSEPSINRVRCTQAVILRSPSTSVVWPGEYLEVDLPEDFSPDCTVSIEARPDCMKAPQNWPPPTILEAVCRKTHIVNDSDEPKIIKKHDHFCRVRHTTEPTLSQSLEAPTVDQSSGKPVKSTFHSDLIKVDPDCILDTDIRSRFHDLHQNYDKVFNPQIAKYNGAFGAFEAKVNMGPTQPPQRKGKLPQYSRNKLVKLQQRCDDLEGQGVFKRPDDLGITAEYLNSSFLVNKPSSGFRLVTAFTEVGSYSKPQQSLMPDVDSTLRTIAQWRYVIQTDLTKAFYQIPLSETSMRYCGVATPFRGVRVYTRCAMGMPGSETALEELMCSVLGDFLQDGIVAKLADALYCGGSS